MFCAILIILNCISYNLHSMTKIRYMYVYMQVETAMISTAWQHVCLRIKKLQCIAVRVNKYIYIYIKDISQYIIGMTYLELLEDSVLSIMLNPSPCHLCLASKSVDSSLSWHAWLASVVRKVKRTLCPE